MAMFQQFLKATSMIEDLIRIGLIDFGIFNLQFWIFFSQICNVERLLMTKICFVHLMEIPP